MFDPNRLSNIISCRLIFDDNIINNQSASTFYSSEQRMKQVLQLGITKLDFEIQRRSWDIQERKQSLGYFITLKKIDNCGIQEELNHLADLNHEVCRFQAEKKELTYRLELYQDWNADQRIKLLYAYDKHGANIDIIANEINRSPKEVAAELYQIAKDFMDNDEVDLEVKRFED